MKINIYFFVNAELYRVVWTINALLTLTVRSKMLPFSGNNQNITFFGVSPEHFAIGYVHNDNLPLGNIALQYVIPNNCSKVWWCFLIISCTFWRSRKKLSNSPKLSCGFNIEYLQHDFILTKLPTKYEPLILCLSCNKWSCGTYQNFWKEWNALIWQRCVQRINILSKYRHKNAYLGQY